MRAYRNKTSAVYGQVIESVIVLDNNLACDMKDKYMVFKNTETDQNLLRIKKVDNQLYYNVFAEGDWSADINLTLSDPEQIKNLPQEPLRTNNNTYARMDTDFKLYDEGQLYVRLANDPAPKLFVSSSIAFQLESAGSPVATISSTGLDMNSNRITSLADPTTATDAVNRQFLDKYDVPIGTINTFWGYAAPAGYLICNGSSFVAGDYPELYAFLGNSNILPNLQGAFLRGASDGTHSTLDTTNPRAVRSYQADQNVSHAHDYLDTYSCENLGTNLGFLGHSDPDYDNQPLTMNRTTNSSGGAEARPRNYAVLMIIKAKLSRNI